MRRLLVLVAVLSVSVAASQADTYLDPKKASAGQAGYLQPDKDRVWRFNVVQVMDGTNMLVRQPGESALLWVQGINTDGLVDGKTITLGDILFTVATKSYTNTLGAKTTVLMFVSETAKEKADRLEAARKEAETKAAAQAEVAAKLKAQADAERNAKIDEARAKEAERYEGAAAAKLKLAKGYVESGSKALAKKKLEEIVKEYPMAKVVGEAKELLKKLQ